MGNTFSRFYNPQLVEYLGMMRKYGPKFLDQETFEAVHADMVRNYRRMVARRLISGRGRAYWAFHRDKLKHLGYDIGALGIARGAVEELAHFILHPRQAAKMLSAFIARQRATRNQV